MIDILSNIIQVIVFSSGTNALLRVDGTLNIEKLQVGVTCSQKLGLVLIHTGIGEQEGWIIVRDAGGGRPVDVIVFLEEINKRLTDSVHGPFQLSLLCLRHDGYFD